MAIVCLILSSLPQLAWAQASPSPPGADEQELAKQLANPISSLVSLPFQFNWEQNVGPKDQTRFILNVQPVMPFAINGDWNLIARVIVPFVSQPPLVGGWNPGLRRGRRPRLILLVPLAQQVDLGRRTGAESAVHSDLDHREREIRCFATTCSDRSACAPTTPARRR